MASHQSKLQRAQVALRSGRAGQAADQCRDLLRERPRDAEAVYLYASCLATLGRFVEAAGEFRRVLSIRGEFTPARISGAIALMLSGQPQEALAWLETAWKSEPTSPQVHFGIGLCREHLGDLAAAAASFREAIARNPAFADAYNHLGVVYDRLGDLPNSIESFRQACALQENVAQPHLNLGSALLRSGQAAAAADAYQRVTSIRPQDALAHADFGAALLTAAEYSRAAAALEQALVLDAGLPFAAANLGEALRNLGRFDQATDAFNRALMIQPGLAEAHLGIGRIAASSGDFQAATAHLIKAAETKPDNAQIAMAAAATLEQLGAHAQALQTLKQASILVPSCAALHDAHGLLLHRLGFFRDAIACYEKALGLDARQVGTHLNHGRALESSGSVVEAIRSSERACVLNPTNPEAWALQISCALRLCDWALAQHGLARLRSLPLGIDALHPFLMLALEVGAAEQADSLRRRERVDARAPRKAALRPYAHERLRVAYLSPDLREHPVAHAIVGMIERHDRLRITPIGIYLAAQDASDIGRRLRSAFDEVIDASSSSDAALAALLREREIDVAVDLAGHTVGARRALFALRVAPVQINYLGFPGSLGADHMDFIVADRVVLPLEHERYYAERVCRMPNSYLPFDCTRSIEALSSSREAAGLPSDGFVFCGFSTNYKISSEIFDVWMRLLQDVPRSVLWLRSTDEVTRANLQSAAAARGISATRLVFASFEPRIEAHLARLGLADLFLDTSPYNAHTTATEALWVGVPVITCLGTRFAGRVGASVLTAVDLSELVCADLEEYRRLACELARSPARLNVIRDHLRNIRNTAPLFDTDRYTRDFEALLLSLPRLEIDADSPIHAA